MGSIFGTYILVLSFFANDTTGTTITTSSQGHLPCVRFSADVLFHYFFLSLNVTTGTTKSRWGRFTIYCEFDFCQIPSFFLPTILLPSLKTREKRKYQSESALDMTRVDRRGAGGRDDWSNPRWYLTFRLSARRWRYRLRAPRDNGVVPRRKWRRGKCDGKIYIVVRMQTGRLL